MDHWTRRIVGFGVQRGVVDGVTLCRMFNHATSARTGERFIVNLRRRNPLPADQNPKLMPKSILRMPLTVVGLPKNGEVNVPLYPR
jgi:hypothetical protein